MRRLIIASVWFAIIGVAHLAAGDADQFVNVLGDAFRFPKASEGKSVAIVFLGADCPISNAFAPEIARIAKKFSGPKITFCVVYADADLTKEAAAKHAKEFGFTCPALLDPAMKLVRKVGATIKPEAAILSPKGEVLYRGRIDDRFVDFSKQREAPTMREFRDALEAVRAGKAVPTPRTTAIGCDIVLPSEKK
jgi:hypothetical protein